MSTQKQRPAPKCIDCPDQEFESMDEFSDHIADEHDAFTKAMMRRLANKEEIYDDPKY